MADMTDTAVPAPSFPVPTSLSPSRVSSFTSCPMQFRFSSIERLPEPPGVATTKGSVVHRALELLFVRPAVDRTPEALAADLATALDEYSHRSRLRRSASRQARPSRRSTADCHELVDKYFAMEDPTKVREIGLELWMEAPVGDLTLRGIIDRLELDADGELVVTDYKTGRAPSGNYEQKSLAGVHFYSFLCEAVFGKRPAKIRLMYLEDRRDDRDRAVGAVGQVHHHAHDRRVVGGRTGMHERRLPAARRATSAASARSSGGVRRSAATRRWPPSRRPPRTRRCSPNRSPSERANRHRPPRPVRAPSRSPVPGQSHLGPSVDRFDEQIDELLERLRGHPAADRFFLAATHLGDFSLIWHIIGITRGIIKRKPDEVVVLAALLGIESLIVNQGVKRLFRRDRPTTTGDDRLPVRQPSTSSFPSGHATSATFAAIILSVGRQATRRLLLHGRRDRRHQPGVRADPSRLRRDRRGSRRHRPRPDRPPRRPTPRCLTVTPRLQGPVRRANGVRHPVRSDGVGGDDRLDKCCCPARS